MTQSHFNRSKLAKIMTWQAYQRLERYVRKRQGQIPYPLSVKQWFHVAPGRFYYSKLLTKIVKQLMQSAGWIVDEPHDTGRKVKTKTGKEVYVKTKLTRKGQADLKCLGPGKYWEIEIKIDDKQSLFQAEHESTITAMGHHYTITHTVDEFFRQYELITKTLTK